MKGGIKTLHSDDMIKRIFEGYRTDLRDLERQKAALDTEAGKKLLSLPDGSGVQCEITETKEGVIVTYYRLNPEMLTSPDLEPTRVMSVFYDAEMYYNKEELEELEEEEEEEEASADRPDVYAPEEQPQGPRPELFTKPEEQGGRA